MHEAHYSGYIKLDNSKLCLKVNEVLPLKKMCELLSSASSEAIPLLDGYYVGFSIPQISNEFDLLRFGTNYIVNVELKCNLLKEPKIDKIHIQMRKQYHYLKFLEKPLKIYTYIEDDGFYRYDIENDSVERVQLQDIVCALTNQQVDFEIDPEKLFKPSNYLVSPFNKVERFISSEYFLTPDQAKNKKEILKSIGDNEYLFFCISADAGTGKTLLTYDIAKTYQENKKSVLVLHCASLNEGQQKLIDSFGWNIKCVSVLKTKDPAVVIGVPDLIIVDEAHRIRKNQLDALVQYAFDKNITILFSYDVKQYLRDGESKEIRSYLLERYAKRTAPAHKLTKKIRINKKMASFIHNMLEIGSSMDNLDYENVTIEYFSDAKTAQNYLTYLDNLKEWKAITFTPSQYKSEPIDSLSSLCEQKAHGVIGQEFDKVVFAMDSNFKYIDNRLSGQKNYYSLKGMLYQIVTRAVNELKIIVINNPKLYEKLISVKCIGDMKID